MPESGTYSFIRCRPMRIPDVAQAARLTMDRDWYSPDEHQALQTLWRALIGSGAANAWVMEDLAAPPGERLVHFGIVVFTSDTFAAEIPTLPPGLGLQILGRWQAGSSPLLSLPQIRAANSGEGLHMVYPWFGMPEWGMTERGRPIRDQFLDAARFLHFGYQVRQFYSVAHTPTARDWGLEAGAEVMTDYGLPPDAAKPCWLMRATPGQVLEREGTLGAVVFSPRQVHFFFRPVEQELLLWALSGNGDTDEELAAQLHLACITVKKRWESIHQRVEAVAPELLASDEAVLPRQKRGAEKKRRLLAYLRHHMEELRPLLPPES